MQMNAQNAQLLAAIQNNDREAFSRIIDRSVGQRAFVYAVSLFEDDRTQAENVAQNAVDKVLTWITEDKMLSLDNPIAYMQEIVRNHILNESKRRKERFLPLTYADKQELACVDQGFAKFHKEEDVEPHPWRVFMAKDMGVDEFKNFSPLQNPRLRFLLPDDRDKVRRLEYKLKLAFYRSIKTVYDIPSKNGSQVFSLYLRGYGQNEIAQIIERSKSSVSESINHWQTWMGWSSSQIDMFRISWLTATLVRLRIITRFKKAQLWDHYSGCWYNTIIPKTSRNAKPFGILAAQHPELQPLLDNLNEDEQYFYLEQVPDNYLTVILDPPPNWRQVLPAFKAWANTDYGKLDKLSHTGSWATFWRDQMAYHKRHSAAMIREEHAIHENWKWGMMDKARSLPMHERSLHIEAWSRDASGKDKVFLDGLKQLFVLWEGFHS